MKLKELRTTNGLTQKELGEKLGVSSQTILNWENELFEPKIKDLISLADFFNVTLDYLVGRKKTDTIVNTICKEINAISKEKFVEFIRDQLTDNTKNDN